MKRLLIWAGILASLLSPANAAGTVPGFSLTPQFDSAGKIMPGCKLYTIVAGTTQTPQNSYQDSALTILQPNPLLCDATGRLPQWFVADGQIKVRLTNANGIQQFVGDNLLVVGASSGGGGGGGGVDPTTIIATGDVKIRYGTGVLTGFVRMNGRTIGSATSGATERANADAQSLFEYLWNNDPFGSVSGGKGASANADWVANKTIVLPDARGRSLSALADMGNSDNNIFSGASFSSGNSTTLGSKIGAARRLLSASHIPTITSLNTNGFVVNSGSTVSDVVRSTFGLTSSSAPGGGSLGQFASSSGNTTGGISSQGVVDANAIGSSSTNTGGQSFDAISPYILITAYMKL